MVSAQKDEQWTTINKVSITLLIGFVAWLGSVTIETQREVGKIGANRFTSSDGMGVYAELSRIREDLAAIPREVPPKWFREDVEDVKRDIKDIENRLKAIEARMGVFTGERP